MLPLYVRSTHRVKGAPAACMYYYIERDGQIFPLMIFRKNEQADLTVQQKKSLKQAILGLREARK